MKISVIMPSFLGEYEGCASNREEKFMRSVNSFLQNDYDNKELIIVCDGCELTQSLLCKNFSEHLQKGIIKYYFVKKESTFSGNIRSVGLKYASGDYIMYLDTDDMFGKNHIKSVVSQIKNLDWGYYNDYIYTPNGLQVKNVECVENSIGTSSIFHKNLKSINWDKCNGYGHDFKFVKKLVKWSKNYDKVYGASYIICHIPNILDM